MKRKWCGRVDSNHHGIATASPSSWCVCQFRHDRVSIWRSHYRWAKEFRATLARSSSSIDSFSLIGAGRQSGNLEMSSGHGLDQQHPRSQFQWALFRSAREGCSRRFLILQLSFRVSHHRRRRFYSNSFLRFALAFRPAFMRLDEESGAAACPGER